MTLMRLKRHTHIEKEIVRFATEKKWVGLINMMYLHDLFIIPKAFSHVYLIE